MYCISDGLLLNQFGDSLKGRMFGIAEQLEQNTFDIGNGNALTAQLRQTIGAVGRCARGGTFKRQGYGDNLAPSNPRPSEAYRYALQHPFKITFLMSFLRKIS